MQDVCAYDISDSCVRQTVDARFGRSPKSGVLLNQDNMTEKMMFRIKLQRTAFEPETEKHLWQAENRLCIIRKTMK